MPSKKATPLPPKKYIFDPKQIPDHNEVHMKKVTRILAFILSLILAIPFFAFPVMGDEDSKEYILFESFEYPASRKTPPNNWSVYTGTAGYEFREDKPTHGTSYAVITDNSDTYGAGFRSNKIPVTPETYLLVSADVMLLEGGGGHVFIEVWDAANNRISCPTLEGAPIGEWKNLSGTVFLPEKAKFLSILLYSGGTDRGIAAYDNVRVKKVEEQDNVEPMTLAEDAKTHPRLFFTASEKDDFVKRSMDETVLYNKNTMKSYRETVLKNADKFISETQFALRYHEGYTVTFKSPTDMPGKMPNPPGYNASGGSSVYPYWTHLAEAIQERMETLSIAYAMTGDRKYADKAIVWAEKMLTWSVWSDPYYGTGSTSLDTCHITFGMCAVYDILYDILSAEDRKAIEEALIEKSMKKLYVDAHNLSTHNSQMLKCSALMTASCTIFEADEKLCTMYINKVKDYLTWYMDTVMSHPENEGLSYLSYTIDHMMIAFDRYSRAFGDLSFYENDFTNKFLMEWIVAAAENLNGVCANIGDCYAASSYFFVTASTVYKNTSSPLAAYYLTRNKSSSSNLEALLYTCNVTNADIPDEKYLAYYNPVIDWGVFRTGWSPSDPTMFIVSSQSKAGHAHRDANSFSIALNGAWIAAETGYRSYDGGDETEYSISGGHNTIAIDGMSQDLSAGGNLESRVLSPVFGMLQGSAEKAYSSDFALNSFERSFVMVGFDTPYYIIRDLLSSDKEHEYTWRLNTDKNTGVTIDGRSFDVKYTGASIGVDFAFDDALSIKNTKFKSTSHPVVDATSAKTKDHEFMAFLTPYMEGNIKYEFKNIGTNYTVKGEGAEAKQMTIDIFNTLLFRPKTLGDSVSFDLTVPFDGDYKISLKHLTGKSYGAVSLSIDGTEIGIADGYRDGYADAAVTDFENISLKGGQNCFTFTWCESAAAEADKYGFIHLELTSSSDAVPDITVKNSVKEENFSAARVSHSTGDIEDIIIFNDGSESVTWENASVDGSFGGVFGIANEKISGYVVENGTSVTLNGASLLTSTEKITATADLDGTITLSCEKSADITLLIPKDAENVKYGESLLTVTDGLITFTAEAGESKITFDIPEDIEAVPEKSFSALLIVIPAVILVAASVIIVLLLRKNKKIS